MKRIVVVGAGPQALAVLLRLFSNKSLFTDREMTTEKKYWDQKTLNIDLDSVVVIDPKGWLGCWKEKLEKQQLEYLRSPLFFHPGKKSRCRRCTDPSSDSFDNAALHEYAHKTGRSKELIRIVDNSFFKKQGKKVSILLMYTRWLTSTGIRLLQ